MRNNKKMKRFTLVEIIVSMGVFLILLTLLLNFFSGTRQVWKNLRERNEAFENSRVAMNLISDLVLCSVASRDRIGFFVPANNSSCTFYTHSTRQLVGAPSSDHCELDNLYAVKIERDSATGELVIYSSRVKGMTVPDAWNTAPTVTGNKKVIIPAVSDVQFKKLIATSANNRPGALEITLRMFDNKANYKHWSDTLNGSSGTESSEAKDYRLAHEYSFSRVISFEDIDKPIYEVSDAQDTP